MDGNGFGQTGVGLDPQNLPREGLYLRRQSYDKEKLPQISKYGLHLAHFSIQSNPESAELANFWSSPIQIRLDWTGLWIQRIDPVHSILCYKCNQWHLPNILGYISGIFDGFFKPGLVPLTKLTLGQSKSNTPCRNQTQVSKIQWIKSK